ncbi:MAG: small ribosomal subunit Rsm22 family protein, partial [Blastocatellia bacterium]
MRLPEELNRAIEKEISRPGSLPLRKAASDISDRYRGSEGGPIALSSGGRIAYLATRLPSIYAAVSSVLMELRKRLPGTSPRSLLDLGAGPGTAVWAAVECFEDLEKITLIERDIEFSRAGKRIAAHSPVESVSSAEWVTANLTANWTVAPQELVVMSYALGELDSANRGAVVERAWEKTARVLAIIEPGSVRGFQTVLAARSELISMGAHVIAPCPHEQECPLAGGDWCHFSARIERTSWQRRLKSGTLPYEDEKFSYVLVTRDPAETAAARIIRRPHKAKG